MCTYLFACAYLFICVFVYLYVCVCRLEDFPNVRFIRGVSVESASFGNFGDIGGGSAAIETADEGDHNNETVFV